MTLNAAALDPSHVRIANGVLAGTEHSGVASFKCVPFAAPPVGDLRWKPPQPPKNWKGVRRADTFGPRAMQPPIFGDMVFRSDGMAEDCLYLNIWVPLTNYKEKLPVLVYFYGGAFLAGDASEPRYDGESMARKGIVVVTVNYRLGVFGFFAHPGLSQESSHHASGNYGLLDQHAALKWVQKNIAAFGGDPRHVTIAGESAGSVAVSAQMASPLSRKLIAGAIGESGSILGALSAVPLKDGEQAGLKFAGGLAAGKAPSIEELRAMPAARLLEAASKPGVPWFTPVIDGYFFPQSPFQIYAKGEQARVPLLAGSNTEESGPGAVLGRDRPTVENYRKALARLYGPHADEVFQVYPAASDAEVQEAARDLASDRFISLSTWRWLNLASQTGKKPAYYYLYAQPRPAGRAVHSAEIEYALGNLDSNKVYAWTPDDYRVSQILQAYFANFIRTGNPNGVGLPSWPEFTSGQRLRVEPNTRAEPDRVRARYELLERLDKKQP